MVNVLWNTIMNLLNLMEFYVTFIKWKRLWLTSTPHPDQILRKSYLHFTAFNWYMDLILYDLPVNKLCDPSLLHIDNVDKPEQMLWNEVRYFQTFIDIIELLCFTWYIFKASWIVLKRVPATSTQCFCTCIFNCIYLIS